MQAARRKWSEDRPRLDVERLVFIDETWASTNMTRSHGRAPKGQRCIGSAPFGDWQTTTFIAALRLHQLTAPMVVDGPMDGELFLAWVEQFLCPTLRPGDIAILDNLSSHKAQGCSRCHPTLPISIPSKSSFQSSRPCSEKPPNDPLKTYGSRSANCSTPSPQPNAKTTSPPLDM